jgi:pimeloyl-ACP methyl ester carboxylesterase
MRRGSTVAQDYGRSRRAREAPVNGGEFAPLGGGGYARDRPRSFAGDAAALANRLGHERFAVVGVSAGGPYALACAHELPARIAATTIVGCMAPGADPGTGLPRLARAGLRCVHARPEACAR